MEAFPAFYPLSGRRVIIAGDGEGAEAKARLFRGSPAEVIRLDRAAALDPAAYLNADLIFVASYDNAFVAAAAHAARGAAAPLNVVDHPELSDFHTPAIIDRGQVVAAIGSAGAAPLLAALLRAEIGARISAGAGRMASLLGERREALRAAFPDLPVRRAFLRAILAGPAGQAAETGDMALAADRLDDAIACGWSAVGRVSFMELPVAADLLSLRAVRALNTADIVVRGFGAEDLIEAHGRRDAEFWTPAVATEEALATQATAGRLIVVLDHDPSRDLAGRLEARGVSVEHLAPAATS